VTTHALRDRRWRAFAEPVGADEDPEYHALVRAPLGLARCECRHARPARARAGACASCQARASCMVWACRAASGAKRAGVKPPGRGVALPRAAARAAAVRLGPKGGAARARAGGRAGRPDALPARASALVARVQVH